MPSESFGPRLRWQRIQKGVSLDEIASQTKVPVELWEAMEADDFAEWPTGVYVRTRLRDYAALVGLDADVVVDDFCRIFPQRGDRRREGLVRGQAEIVGHRFSSVDTPLPSGVREDRRATRNKAADRRASVDMRVSAAMLDQCLVLATAGAVSLAAGHFWMALALVTIGYHAASVASIGCSPGAWLVRAYAARHAHTPPPADVFTPVPRTVDHS